MVANHFPVSPFYLAYANYNYLKQFLVQGEP